MKIEIEVTEDEVADQIRLLTDDAVKRAVQAKMRSWNIEVRIRQIVDQLWDGEVKGLVAECLAGANRGLLTKQVQAVMNEKLKQQAAAALRKDAKQAKKAQLELKP